MTLLKTLFTLKKKIKAMKVGNVLPSIQNEVGGMFFLFWGEAAVSRVKMPIFTFLKSNPVVYIFKLTVQICC